MSATRIVCCRQDAKQADSVRRLFALASCQTGILSTNVIRMKGSRDKSDEVNEELGSPIASNLQMQIFHMYVDKLSKTKTAEKFKALVGLRSPHFRICQYIFTSNVPTYIN